MDDKKLIELIYELNDLPEYRRKQIAILLMSTTLNPIPQKQLAGWMAEISDNLQKEIDLENNI
tara:strand:+ start:253 stop:441 length:189 start_codon:yes stop_codon:yes gene_type:complete